MWLAHQVEARPKEDPNDIYEVPVKGPQLERSMARRRKPVLKRQRREPGKHRHPDSDVDGVKPGRNVVDAHRKYGNRAPGSSPGPKARCPLQSGARTR